MRNAPGILSVKSEALHILRKGAIASRSESATDARRRIGRRIALRARRRVVKRQRSGGAPTVRSRSTDVAIGIERICSELLRRSRECAAEDRFVNKINSEFQRVASRDVAEIVAHLVFILIAQVGEKRNGSVELIVAKSFEA